MVDDTFSRSSAYMLYFDIHVRESQIFLSPKEAVKNRSQKFIFLSGVAALFCFLVALFASVSALPVELVFVFGSGFLGALIFSLVGILHMKYMQPIRISLDSKSLDWGTKSFSLKNISSMVDDAT